MKNQYLKQIRDLYGDELYIELASNIKNTSTIYRSNNNDDINSLINHSIKCQKFSFNDGNFFFGLGDPNASLLLVGDGNSDEENLKSKPFDGDASKLLDKILLAINRSLKKDVYICNVFKSELLKNIDSSSIQIKKNESYLFHHINLIKPKLIVALGEVAGMTLLNVDNSLKSMRGVLHDFKGTPLIVTFHPSDLLINSDWKIDAWKDFKWIRSIIE